MSSQKKPVALVVGASRGIGRQIAVDLASNGYAGAYMYQQSNSCSTYLTDLSRRRCQNHQRPFQAHPRLP